MHVNDVQLKCQIMQFHLSLSGRQVQQYSRTLFGDENLGGRGAFIPFTDIVLGATFTHLLHLVSSIRQTHSDNLCQRLHTGDDYVLQETGCLIPFDSMSYSVKPAHPSSRSTFILMIPIHKSPSTIQKRLFPDVYITEQYCCCDVPLVK